MGNRSNKLVFMDNTNNKKYWNDYVTYWENKVKEANNKKSVKDRTNDDIILETYYKKLNVKENDKLLDYGCGSGRLYPIYKKEILNNNYFGIDISGICLEHAQKQYHGLILDNNLKEFDGVHIPFQDNFFNKIVCFGVFDACHQESVISELFRVLDVEGVLLITGKNKRYYLDDEAALVAEINARKKGHPNYFTDVKNFVFQLLEHNVELLETCYFCRRGDFPKNKKVYDMPERFYEWAFLLKKTYKYKKYEFRDLSYKSSDKN